MAKFSKLIEAFCLRKGIEIPPGFYRRAASRYAIVHRSPDTGNSRLVARTWFKVADVIYYLDNHATAEPLQIYDFKDMRMLERKGKVLSPIGDIDC